MSRIAGIFRPASGAARQRLERIHQSLRSRGYTCQALHIGSSLSLSYHHISGASPGAEAPQPFSFRGNWIVSDATLYNREELCRELPGAGPEASDAELIARACTHWGTDGLPRLQGDFAFAFWDDARQRLFCARDPIGIRPFFYRWQDNSFVWASEIRALLADPDYSPAPDEALLAEYLLGWSHYPDVAATFYRGIRQLPAGHFLILDRRGRLRLQRYWDIKPADEARYRRPLGENVEEFRHLLNRAVRQRLRASSPVGLLLSGGLDSTSIGCLGMEVRRDNHLPPLHFYNYYVPAPYGDEREYVHAFQQKYGAGVEAFGPQSFRLFEGLDEEMRASAVPVADPLWHLTRQLSNRLGVQNVRVMLSGFGGDNIFPDAIGACTDSFRSGGWLAGRQSLRCTARYWDVRPFRLWPQVLRSLLPPRLKIAAKRIVGKEIPPWVRRDFARRSGLLERVRQPLPRQGFSTPSKEMTYLQLTSGRFASQLTAFDEFGAVSLFECRHPFLDPALVRLTLLAPSDQKTAGGEIKLLLREAMRGLLPETIRQRRDKGTVDFFLARWLREREGDKLQLLAHRDLFMASYVDVRRFRGLVRSFLHGNEETLNALWSLVSLEFWLRNNFECRRVGENPNPFAGQLCA